MSAQLTTKRPIGPDLSHLCSPGNQLPRARIQQVYRQLGSLHDGLQFMDGDPLGLAHAREVLLTVRLLSADRDRQMMMYQAAQILTRVEHAVYERTGHRPAVEP